MHRSIAPFIITIVFGILSATGQESRIWTSKSGATVEASFVKATGNSIALKKSDGSMIQIQRSGLSSEDNAYLDKYLFKPQTITVSLEPMWFGNKRFYGDASSPKGALENRRRDPRQRLDGVPNGPQIRQGDILIYKYKSNEYIDEWADDSTWKVLNAEEVKGELNGNSKWKEEKRTTDGRFIIVTFQLTNNGQYERVIWPVTIRDSKDRVYNPIDDLRYFILDQCEDPNSATLAPGFTGTYCNIYEIPEDAADINLNVPTFERYDYEGISIPISSRNIPLIIHSRNEI